jgi:predicted phage-related endonuclease
MSIELEVGVIELDDGAQAWLLAYRDVTAKIAELEEKRAIAREHLESALGEAETACIKGHPVVRFTKVESKRFDTKRAREILPPQVLDVLEVVSYSRRFTLVKDDE